MFQKWRPVVCQFFMASLCLLIAVGCTAKAKQARILNRAENYFKAGKYDEARIEYLNLLRLDPVNALAAERVGTIWLEDGAPLRAYPYLIKARELAPQNVTVWEKLTSAYLALGHYEEARKEATALLKEAPGSDDALLVLIETARTPETLAATKEVLHGLPQKEKASFHLASANVAVREKNVPAVEELLQKALAADPKLPAAHLALGALRSFQKKPEEASQEFKTASDLAPVRSLARLKYAEFKFQAGDIAGAKELLKAMTVQAPDYLSAWRILAQVASAEKNYDESLKLMENVFSRDPENFNTRLLQADVCLQKGDSKKAVDTLERLNKVHPNMPVVKYQLARAYLQNNNPAQAPGMLAQAIAANPDYVEALLLLGELNLRLGDAAPVVAAMQGLLKKQPNLLPAQVLLSEAYRSLGQLDDAMAVIRAQIKANPKNAQSHLLLGLLHRQQNKLAEARKSFETALEIAPDNLLVLAQIVDLDVTEKKFAVALDRVRAQIQKNPKAAGVQFLEARVYSAQGEWDHAEAALLKTLDIDPNFSRAYDLLIATYISANKLAPAIGQLEGLLTKNPNNSRALMMTALIYDKKGDLEKTGDSYEKLLAASPEFVPALNNLAYLYAVRLKDVEKGYELARKARSLQPDDASVADTFGWILYQRGDYKQSLALLQQSVAKIPDNSEIQFHLGMAAYMMGQADLARSAFQKALAGPEAFSGKDEIPRRLAILDDGTKSELSIGQLEAMVKEYPNDLMVRLRLASVYEKQGAFEKASTTCEEALQLNPKLLGALLKLAQLNAGPLKHKEKAFEFAKKARELAPEDPQASGILGGVAYRTGNYSWAYSLLKESSRQLKSDPAVLHDAAWAAYSLGKVEEARETMQKIPAEGSAAFIIEDAKIFLSLTAPGDGKAAAELQIQAALKANPSYGPALMARAAIERQRSDLKAATASYLEVLQLYPDFTPAQKQLAGIYVLDPENRVKAYELAIKARKDSPNDAALAEVLAELSFYRKEFAYAIQLFQQSALDKPLDAKQLYCLGVSYFQTKQKPKSRETLDQALALGLQDPSAADARRLIAEIDGTASNTKP